MVITCPKEEADAVYSAHTDRFYPLKSTGYGIEVYSIAEVEEIPAEVIADYYSYNGGEFAITTADCIAFLRQKLTDTDYQAIKHSEGALSADEYEPVKLQRQAWRDEINELETTGGAEQA